MKSYNLCVLVFLSLVLMTTFHLTSSQCVPRCPPQQFCPVNGTVCRDRCASLSNVYHTGRRICMPGVYHQKVCDLTRLSNGPNYQICHPSSGLTCQFSSRFNGNRCLCAQPLAYRFRSLRCDFKIFDEVCYNTTNYKELCKPNSGLFCNTATGSCKCEGTKVWNNRTNLCV